MLAPGIAIVVVPPLADWLGWRAPYLSAIVVAGVCVVLLALAPSAKRTLRHAGERLERGFFRDRRLYRFAAIHAMSFGFSVIVGNWVVTLLEHHGHSKGSASLAGSLTLLLGFFTRLGGGTLLRRRDASRWVAASLVIGGARRRRPRAAAPALRRSSSPPRSSASPRASRSRWRSPAPRRPVPTPPERLSASSTRWASLVIVAGTPLVGLTFSLPGDGRIGFVALGLLAALAALATPR